MIFLLLVIGIGIHLPAHAQQEKIKNGISMWPHMVSGIVFAFFQWYSSNFLGPMLPDVIAGLASIISLMLLLRYWKPKTTWRFKEEPQQTIDATVRYSTGQILRAWSPFIIMTMFVIAWGSEPIKAA